MSSHPLDEIWPSVALVFTASLFAGKRVIPGGAIGLGLLWIAAAVEGGASLAAGAPAGVLVGAALAGLAGACAAPLVAMRETIVDSVRGILWFAATGAVLLPALSTAVVALALLLRGGHLDPRLDGTLPLQVFFVGTGSVALLVAPALLWLAHPVPHPRRSRTETAGCALALAGVSWAAFGHFEGLERSYPPLYVVLPVLVWAALRFGSKGSAFGVLTVAVVALLGLAIRYPASGIPLELQLRMQLYLSFLAVSMLPLGAAVEERQRAREALEEERRELDRGVEEKTAALSSERDLSERAIETSGALVAILDGDGTVQRVNSAFARAAGRDASGLPGTRFTVLVDVDPEVLRAALRLDRSPEETRGRDAILHSAAGPDREVRWRFQRLRGADELLVAGLDFTDRNEAHRQLARSIEVLQATLEATADAILAVDLDGRVIAHNPRFRELWAPPQDLLDRRDGAALDAFLAGRTVDPAAYAEAAARLAAYPDLEAADVLVLRDSRVIERFSLPERTDDRIVGRVSSYRDVTEARRAEAERNRSLAAERAARVEAERAFGRAREAVRLREDFLVVASHELRTPLTSIKAQLQGLKKTFARAGPSAVRESLRSVAARIGRQLARLDAVVDELLDVSELSSGPASPRFAPCDLRNLVETAIAQRAESSVLAGAPIRLRDGGPVEGSWDPSQLNRLIAALLGNATKFGAGRPIDVSIEELGALVELTVADRGIGIDVEDQRRIFERFERAVDSRHFGGLGLGLWIARRIAESHGGSIRVASRPGEGASFTLTLPRRPSAPALEATLAGASPRAP